MILSKNKIKYIRSLKDKKFRDEHQTFLVEGNKMTGELLAVLKCQILVATSDFLQTIPSELVEQVEEVYIVKDADMERVSLQRQPQQALAVFYQPDASYLLDSDKDLVLALDDIQDPGNMGTIIRLADWYGINQIFCSQNTVDVYNPKVVQATMGALARVRVVYIDLHQFLSEQQSTPIYGTFLDGQNIYTEAITPNGIIVMGNEGNGISREIERLINSKLYIPSYPAGEATSESLNVAVATAIVCAEFRRRVL